MDGLTLRELEAASIRSFVESCSEHFTGRVLDYGCGKSPYRDIVEAAGGEYVGYDRVEFPANVSGGNVGPGEDDIFLPHVGWDAVLLLQVVQYLPMDRYSGDGGLQTILGRLNDAMTFEGVLVTTWPLTWPLVEGADLHRFTAIGMTRLLADSGFTIERLDSRGEFKCMGETFYTGFGAVARA